MTRLIFRESTATTITQSTFKNFGPTNIIHSLKNKHITTPAQDQKQKFPKKVPTEIEYHEKGHWTKGENIITVMGGLPGEPKQPIAHVKLLDYDEDKKPILAALDLEGNEIFERTSNLYQLKKQIREQEQRLTKEMIIWVAATPQIEPPVADVSQEIPEDPKVGELTKTRRRKESTDQSQSLTQ